MICIRKKRGPKTGPCDTLAHIRSQSDMFPIRVALWTLSLRNLLINLSRFPLTPLCFNLNNKPSCNTLWGHSKSKVRLFRRGGGPLKREQKRTGGVFACVYVRFSKKKKMPRFSKWSFIVILQFILLIIMAIWNIKILKKPSWKILIFSPVNECRRLLSPAHTRSLMWVMLKIFTTFFCWLNINVKVW